MRQHASVVGLLIVIYGITLSQGATYTVSCCSFATLSATLSSAISGDTVILGAGTFAAATSDTLPVPVKAISITGAGSGVGGTTVSLGGRPGFLNATVVGTLNVSNMLIRDGRDDILTYLGDLRAFNVAFVNLTSLTSKAAAILITRGTANFTRCLFSGSYFATTLSPAFIKVSGALLTITDSIFRDNVQASSPSPGYVTVNNMGGTVVLTNTLFVNNTDRGVNPNVLIGTDTGSTTIINGCNFTANTAGQLIYALNPALGSSLLLNNTVFSGNKGILRGVYATIPTTITGCTFASNNNSGSTLFVRNNIIVTNTSFTSNAAGAPAMTINMQFGTVATVSGCTFNANAGGALSVTGANVTLNDTIFTLNNAADAPGCVTGNAGTWLTVSGCTFSQNTASGLGMGGALNTDRLLLLNSTFMRNVASTGAAARLLGLTTIMGCYFSGHTTGNVYGTVSIGFSGYVNISRTTFTKNFAGTSQGQGGAICADTGVQSTVTVRDSQFIANSANRAGVFFGITVLQLVNVYAANNSAPGGRGGVMNSGADYIMTVDNSTFLGNSALTQGGVFNGQPCTTIVVRNSVFVANRVGTDGHGAVTATMGEATFTNCLFLDNIAFGGYGSGAVTYDTTFLRIYASTFVGNDASNGGLVDRSSAITIDGSTFSDTVSSQYLFLSTEFGGKYITNCVFANNEGGIVSNAQGFLTLRNISVNNHAAIGPSMLTVSVDTVLVVDRCSFTENLGTGMLLDATSNGVAITITRSIFTGNDFLNGVINAQSLVIDSSIVVGISSYSLSIAAPLTAAFNITCINTTVANFTNGNPSSGLYAPTVIVTGSTFKYLVSDTSLSAGAVYVTQASVINGSTFIDCLGTIAGAVYTARPLSVNNSTFIGSYSKDKGGAVRCDGTALNVAGSQFTRCSAESYGGALYTAGALNLQDSAFYGNSGAFGGAVYSGLTVINHVTSDADIGTAGGFLYTQASINVTIRYLTVRGARATAGHGGAVYINVSPTTSTTTMISASTLSSCLTSNNGGAVYLAAVNNAITHRMTLDSVTILKSTAKCSGGGVYGAAAGTTLTISNSIVSNNTAAFDGGGVAAVFGPATILTGNNIVGNTAGATGGGIYSDVPSLTVTDTQVMGNSADKGGGFYAHGNTYQLLGMTSFSCNTARTNGSSIYCNGATATVGPNVILATSSQAGVNDVHCAGCGGDCVQCRQCNGGCGQGGNYSGCYFAPTACTSCPVNYYGPHCEVANATECGANLGCPLAAVGQTCTIACDPVHARPNPAFDMTGTVLTCTKTGVWPYSNSCLACPLHMIGPNCSQAEPYDCTALADSGVLTGCPNGYINDTCTPICDAANHYELNPDVTYPLTCGQSPVWITVGQPFCVITPPLCAAISPALTVGMREGCSPGYFNDTCAPTCLPNYHLSPTIQFPLTCTAISWDNGLGALCVPCPAGTSGANCATSVENFCPAPTATNAHLSVPTACHGRVGEVCSFVCDGGFGNSSSLDVTCQISGAFTTTAGCTACDAHCDGCTSPSVCVKCAAGWSGAPICSNEVRCGPYASQNGLTSSCATVSSVPYNTPCTVACQSDATITTTIHCVDAFTWSVPDISCPATTNGDAIKDTSPSAATTAGIAGGVAGVVLVVVVIVILVFVVRRNKRAAAAKDSEGDATARVESGPRKRVEKMLKNAPVLGKGLTAVVYKGQLEDGTYVAIKLATGTSEQASIEFHREAHMLGLLMGRAHEHIIGMRFYCDNPRAIVMDLADGGSVRTLLKEGRPNNALDIIRQIGDGIQTLHDHNIAHLDIKPENVLIGSDGKYKITDFGCAVSCAPDAEKIPQGTFLGTPQYCSPERFLLGVVDPKGADVYSFALTIWGIYEAISPLAKDTYDTPLTKFSSDVTFPLKELTMAPDTPHAVVRAVVLGIKRELHVRATISQLRTILSDTSVAASNPAYESTQPDLSSRISLFSVHSLESKEALATVVSTGSQNSA